MALCGLVVFLFVPCRVLVRGVGIVRVCGYVCFDCVCFYSSVFWFVWFRVVIWVGCLRVLYLPSKSMYLGGVIDSAAGQVILRAYD